MPVNLVATAIRLTLCSTYNYKQKTSYRFMILLLLFDAGVTTAVAHSHWDTFSSTARTVYLLAITATQFFGAGAVPSTEPAARGNGPSPRDWNAALCMCMWVGVDGRQSVACLHFIYHCSGSVLLDQLLFGRVRSGCFYFSTFLTLDQGHSHGWLLVHLQHCSCWCGAVPGCHTDKHIIIPHWLAWHVTFTIELSFQLSLFPLSMGIWQQPGKNILR